MIVMPASACCPHCGDPVANPLKGEPIEGSCPWCGVNLRRVVPVFAPTMGGPAWWGWKDTVTGRCSWEHGIPDPPQRTSPAEPRPLVKMTTRYEFGSVAERNAFIDREFPKRVSDENVPGLFRLPDGRELSVFCNTVTVHGGGMMAMRDDALALVEALDDAEENPEAEGRVRDLARELAGATLRLSFMLSEPDWGVGMLEDIAAIVGPDPNPAGEPRWERH